MQRTSSSNHIPMRRTNSQPPTLTKRNSSPNDDLSPYEFGPLEEKKDACCSVGTSELVKAKTLGNAIKSTTDEALPAEKPIRPQEDRQPAPKKEKLSYWKKMSILIVTLAIALVKLLEPIIRSQFTPSVKQ